MLLAYSLSVVVMRLLPCQRHSSRLMVGTLFFRHSELLSSHRSSPLQVHRWGAGESCFWRWGSSIDAVQKLGDGWLKGFFIRLLQPLHIPDQLSLTDQKQINRSPSKLANFSSLSTCGGANPDRSSKSQAASSPTIAAVTLHEQLIQVICAIVARQIRYSSALRRLVWIMVLTCDARSPHLDSTCRQPAESVGSGADAYNTISENNWAQRTILALGAIESLPGDRA